MLKRLGFVFQLIVAGGVFFKTAPLPAYESETCAKVASRFSRAVGKVRTTYQDSRRDGSSSPKEYSGFGSVLSIPEEKTLGDGSVQITRTRVLATNAHLISGSETYWNGKRIDTRDALVDHHSDLALIRLPDSSVEPLAEFMSAHGLMSFGVDEGLSARIDDCATESGMPWLPMPQSENSYLAFPGGSGFQPKDIEAKVHSISIGGPRPGVGLWVSSDYSPGSALEENFPTESMIAPIFGKRGMSGLPMLSRRIHKTFYSIEGIFQSPYLPTSQSYFVSISALSELGSKWKEGVRGAISPGSWKSHEKILYLDDENGTADLNPVRPPSGGERPGGGGSARGLESEPLLDEGADKIYRMTGTLPGIQYKKQPVLGFDMGDGVLVWADRSVASRIDHFASRKPVLLGANLSDQFAKKMDTESRVFRIENPYVEDPDHRNPQLTFDHGSVTVSFSPPGASKAEDHVRFRLDPQGRLLGSPDEFFNPYIRVSNEAQTKHYLIDVRGLYFASPRMLVWDRGMHSKLSRLGVSVRASELRDDGKSVRSDQPDLHVSFAREDVIPLDSTQAQSPCLPRLQQVQPLSVNDRYGIRTIYQILEKVPNEAESR